MATPQSRRAANDAFYEVMVTERRKLIMPLTGFVLVFYFILPVLTNFTSLLDGVAFSGITWAFVYAFAQFFMVVIVTTIYRRRIDAVEDMHRPAALDETAAHYDDPEQWQHHEEESEEHEHRGHHA